MALDPMNYLHSSLTPREIIERLVKENCAKCVRCGAPATHSCPTAEIGYRLYHCDAHKREGRDELGMDHPPLELKIAPVIRAALRFLDETA